MKLFLLSIDSGVEFLGRRESVRSALVDSAKQSLKWV